MKSQNKIHYAGIGSREVPDEIFKKMRSISKTLAKMGFVLRSGGADGCDTACELGCDAGKGEKEIFLPWRNFNDNQSDYYDPPQIAFEIAEKYHPAYITLTHAVKKIMARNSQQVLGKNCDDPSNFVLCYTESGGLVGGTAQAIRIAVANKIPVFNLGNPDDESLLKDYIKTLL